MQRKRGRLVSIGNLDEPLKKALPLSPQALHHFTRFDHVDRVLARIMQEPVVHC